jgi:hypothetical protein
VHLEVSTFLLQWAAAGLFFLWVTSRGRLVGLGYGWLLRGTYGVLAAISVAAAVAAGRQGTGAVLEEAAGVGVVLAVATALAVSVARRRAGVTGQRALRERRAARVAAMIGRDGPASPLEDGSAPEETAGKEFPPALDLVAPLIGLVGLAGAAAADGGPYSLTLVRLVVGAAFLGVISDAMLLGHWYLVQPGLSREPIKELVRLAAWVWPFEVAVYVWPRGMTQVFTGAIDDGYGGLLAWIWLVCAVSTVALVGVTWLALRERSYSAVMAATGLLYLAILTGFGTDLVARAVLNP